jgi:hypothetical protein
VEYFLEVYVPGSADDVWVTFTASQPFVAISVGDILNPAFWPDNQSPMKVLRAVAVEHIFWDNEGTTKQKVMVFTEEIDGTRELRRGEVA